jgi:hypothetical protein
LAVRKSTGARLSPEENNLMELGDKLKHMESRARGKIAASTKAEKAGQAIKTTNLRAQADRLRLDYMNYALKKV